MQWTQYTLVGGAGARDCVIRNCLNANGMQFAVWEIDLIFINTFAITKHYRGHMSNVPHPACPGCAKPMTAFRAKLAGHPSRRSFHCRECGTIYSEKPSVTVVAADRALTLNFEARSCRPQ